MTDYGMNATCEELKDEVREQKKPKRIDEIKQGTPVEAYTMIYVLEEGKDGEDDKITQGHKVMRNTEVTVAFLTELAMADPAFKEAKIRVVWFELDEHTPIVVFEGKAGDYARELINATIDTQTALQEVEAVIGRLMPRSFIKCAAITFVAGDGEVYGITMINPTREVAEADIVGLASAIEDHSKQFKQQYKEKNPDVNFGDDEGPLVTLAGAGDVAKMLNKKM